jgi:hypothetical protein
MFADDVMIFIKPVEDELCACAWMLDMFGEASRLHVNLWKSEAVPIRCTDEDMAMVQAILGCPTGSYPCRYPGLPLTIRKQCVACFYGLVNRLAACLPTWRAASLLKSGRLLLVQSVI